MGSHSLLQGIFLTYSLNLGFLHCRQILYHLCHQGSSRIPILCWKKSVKNGILDFLLVWNTFSFPCWVWCWHWLCHIFIHTYILLFWVIILLYQICWEFLFPHKWMLNSAKRFSHLVRIWYCLLNLFMSCITLIWEHWLSFYPWDKHHLLMVHDSMCHLFFFLFVVDFVIHWNETAMCLHVFPIPIPPPTSLSTRSL